MNMAHVARLIERSTGVSIRVHGFDTGKGMPDLLDHRDRPELMGREIIRWISPRSAPIFPIMQR
jgi:hypothetical protein